MQEVPIQQLSVYDMLDHGLAEIAEIPVNEYIDKIEKLSDKRMEIVIMALLSENPSKIQKAKNILSLI